jgi:hypothetical protein
MVENEFVKVSEAARLTGVEVNKVYKFINTNKVATKDDGVMMVNLTDLRNALSMETVEPTKQSNTEKEETKLPEDKELIGILADTAKVKAKRDYLLAELGLNTIEEAKTAKAEAQAEKLKYSNSIQSMESDIKSLQAKHKTFDPVIAGLSRRESEVAEKENDIDKRLSDTRILCDNMVIEANNKIDGEYSELRTMQERVNTVWRNYKPMRTLAGKLENMILYLIDATDKQYKKNDYMNRVDRVFNDCITVLSAYRHGNQINLKYVYPMSLDQDGSKAVAQIVEIDTAPGEEYQEPDIPEEQRKEVKNGKN